MKQQKTTRGHTTDNIMNMGAEQLIHCIVVMFTWRKLRPGT